MTKELESSLKDLKSLIVNQRRINSASNLIVVCVALFINVSIFIFPQWVSVVLIVFLFGYLILYKKRIYTQIGQKFDGIQTIFDSINTTLSNLDANALQSRTEECYEKDEIIILKSRVEQLESQLARIEGPPVVTNTDNMDKSKFEIYFKAVLKKIQKLDIEVDAFGEECALYMRKEFSRTLRSCGFEFVDYSAENKMLFATEEGAINNVDCTARAIVTISSPREIVLKGHAFIPETNK